MELENLLQDAVILLASAVAVLLITARLRVPPVVALLLTGILVGPSGFGWIADSEEVEIFAEIGVVFLLFIIVYGLARAGLEQIRSDEGRGGMFGLSTSTWIGLLTATAGLVALKLPQLAALRPEAGEVLPPPQKEPEAKSA